MNKVLVIGNRRRWNGVSVFGAGNAQRSSTLVAHVPGDSHISLLNRNGGRVPLNSLWHGERGGNFCASPFLAAFCSPLPAPRSPLHVRICANIVTPVKGCLFPFPVPRSLPADIGPAALSHRLIGQAG